MNNCRPKNTIKALELGEHRHFDRVEIPFITASLERVHGLRRTRKRPNMDRCVHPKREDPFVLPNWELPAASKSERRDVGGGLELMKES